ncbi:sulfatase-like hydrolase/transferase [Pontiella agarivorans]|uniref:Sulfatase-like hydrolase/transferase n=1 Tax=Pontiella agarivorans TaxID=3038953 RepID=A0ABU5MY87_9BACT|nr:sulfatase-like hydrolase/transferase [Pontiella agarivorans]MDZ8119150.1 sulfatase-like hydrolase/transferase [Pontiella agarivorans]
MLKQLRLLICTGTSAILAYGAEQPLNVIVVMADDLGYECLESYGCEVYQTPQLNKMAEAGVQFSNANAQPICTPSRVQIMTGKYNVKNYFAFARLLDTESTFGNTFRDAGYKTCVVGKWQLSSDYKSPAKFGFDEYCLWKINNKEERYVSPGLVTNGKHETYPGQYGPDIQQAYALDFIRRNKENPFLLYYPMTLVHKPFQPTPDSADWNPNGDPWLNDEKYFSDMINYMDKLVGQLIATVEQLGLSENTLILFTGDNGTTRTITTRCNGKDIAGGKGYTTDAGTHVPLIAKWQGKANAGSMINDLVDFSDIYTTICDASNVKPKEDVTTNLDGISFLPQILGIKGTPRDHSYCWYMERTDSSDIRQFVHNNTYKLYDTGLLFNKVLDPLEKSPLAPSSMSEKEREIKQRFHIKLEHYASLRPPEIQALVKPIAKKHRNKKK